MTARTDQDLLQAALDGALSEAEASELRERLAEDSLLRAEADRLRQLAGLVDTLEPAEPPPDFADQVMDAVAGAQIQPVAWRQSVRAKLDQLLGRVPSHVKQEADRVAVVRWKAGSAGGGGIVAKKALWVVAGLAVVIILGVMYFNGGRPVDQGAQGTIGAADRYRGAQPTSVAVTEGNAQKFLQSDLFDRIVKDKNVRGLLEDTQACEVLGSKELIAVMRGTARAALEDANVHAALGKPAILAALQEEQIFAALADPDTMAALQQREIVAALGGKAASLLENAEVWAELHKNGVRKALADPDFVEAAIRGQAAVRAKLRENPEFDSALRVASLRSLLEDPDVQAALKGANLAKLLEDAEFEAALRHGSRLAAMLKDPEFEAALKGPNLAKLFGEPEFAALVKNVNAAKLFTNLNWAAALKVREFANLFEDADAVAALRDSASLQAALRVVRR